MAEAIEKGNGKASNVQEKPLKVYELTHPDYPGHVAIYRVYSDKTTIAIRDSEGNETFLEEDAPKAEGIEKSRGAVTSQDIGEMFESVIVIVGDYLEYKGIDKKVLKMALDASYMASLDSGVEIPKCMDRVDAIRQNFDQLRKDIAWLSRQFIQPA